MWRCGIVLPCTSRLIFVAPVTSQSSFDTRWTAPINAWASSRRRSWTSTTCRRTNNAHVPGSAGAASAAIVSQQQPPISAMTFVGLPLMQIGQHLPSTSAAQSSSSQRAMRCQCYSTEPTLAVLTDPGGRLMQRDAKPSARCVSKPDMAALPLRALAPCGVPLQYQPPRPLPVRRAPPHAPISPWPNKASSCAFSRRLAACTTSAASLSARADAWLENRIPKPS